MGLNTDGKSICVTSFKLTKEGTLFHNRTKIFYEQYDIVKIMDVNIYTDSNSNLQVKTFYRVNLGLPG